LLDALTPREQQVLRMRFGIGHTREHTLEEVGKLLHLTRERIRPIEQSALAKLRTLASAKELGSYLED
jgi:RNA polymerase primary sigma factor